MLMTADLEEVSNMVDTEARRAETAHNLEVVCEAAARNLKGDFGPNRNEFALVEMLHTALQHYAVARGLWCK